MRRVEVNRGGTHFVSPFPDRPENNIYRAMINEEEHELEWHYDDENIDVSFFKADTEKVHVLAGKIDTDNPHQFTRGILAGGSILVTDMTTSALIAVILKETTEISNTYLIIATGEMQNFDQTDDPVPEPEPPPQYYEIVEWGDDHVEVEGIGTHITLPVSADNVDCFILNPDGSEYIGFDPEPCGDHCIIHLSPGNQTLWYKVVITQ